MQMQTSMHKIDPLWTVHKSVYSEAAFAAENKRLLRKAWLFVAHESDFPEVGSFMTRLIAQDPVLIARGEDGVIRAFYNTCRHRGAIVAPEDAGTARSFLCPYHNWSYKLNGELRALPGSEAYACIGFRKEDFGLAPVRLENFCGLIFVCLDNDAPSLKTFLGPELGALMERTIGAAKHEVYRKDVFPVKANWKLISENWRDGYHVANVHPRLSRGMAPGRKYVLVENGHCIQYIAYKSGYVSDEVWELAQTHTLPGLEPLTGFHFHLFPGLVVQPLNNQFQILSQHPVDAANSVWERRALGVVGDSPGVREARRKCWDAWSSNQVAQDIAVLELQQRGIMSEGMPVSILARGEEMSEGVHGDDNRLRQFWRSWREYMGASQNAWM
jgi:phenylpropionate dioxygenase-like ring-hydroxylating dioxygenase large terminal subunit